METEAEPIPTDAGALLTSQDSSPGASDRCPEFHMLPSGRCAGQSAGEMLDKGWRGNLGLERN